MGFLAARVVGVLAGVAQGAGVGDELAAAVVLVAAGAPQGVGAGDEVAYGVVLVAGDLAQGVGLADAVAPVVVLPGGGDGLGVAGLACGAELVADGLAVWVVLPAVHFLFWRSCGLGVFDEAAGLVVLPGADDAQFVDVAGFLSSGVVLAVLSAAVGVDDLGDLPVVVVVVAGVQAAGVGDDAVVVAVPLAAVGGLAVEAARQFEAGQVVGDLDVVAPVVGLADLVLAFFFEVFGAGAVGAAAVDELGHARCAPDVAQFVPRAAGAAGVVGLAGAAYGQLRRWRGDAAGVAHGDGVALLFAQGVDALGELAVAVVAVLPGVSGYVGDLAQAALFARSAPVVVHAAPCSVLYLGDQAVLQAEAVGQLAQVVEDADAVGAVVGKAHLHAAGVGIAKDAPLAVVVDGVAQPVAPLPAWRLAAVGVAGGLADDDGRVAVGFGDEQFAAAASLVDQACAFDDAGAAVQRVELEVQRRPGRVEPPAPLAPAARDVDGPAQRIDAQVNVGFSVFAIGLAHAGRAGARLQAHSQLDFCYPGGAARAHKASARHRLRLRWQREQGRQQGWQQQRASSQGNDRRRRAAAGRWKAVGMWGVDGLLNCKLQSGFMEKNGDEGG